MYRKYKILAIVMAGGRGERLKLLAAERTKPSVPFGGKYRIIDFTLSNLINSKIYAIYVLVQYKSQSLIEHIRTTWSKEGLLPEHFITVVPPQMRVSKFWYRGTADSVFQNINLIYDFKPNLVAIFSGDHIYRMDIQQMIDFHLKKKAKATVAVLPLEREKAYQFGVVDLDNDFRIIGFKEKPHLEGEGLVYISMGNYIFDANFLIDALIKDNKNLDSTHDFGKDLFPSFVREKLEIYAYDFSQTKIPSLKPYEDAYYWRDVGTIESYWQANMDILGKTPKLDLDNLDWPIYASTLHCPPAYIVNSEIQNSLICEGCKILGATIRNSILGRAVIVKENSFIEDSIIMDFTQIGNNVKIKKTIIDRFNLIRDNTLIGYSRKEDRKNYFLDKSGITIVKRAPRRALYY